ncbi:MAG: hypothetical protein U0R44_03175 [Candidatus Micrarchaeia archaeon]
MRKMILLMALVPLAFAAGGWEGTAALAIAVSATILGFVYAIGFGFGVNELQIMAKEEFYQLIATMLLMVVLVGSNNILDGFSSTLGAVQGAANMQDAANTLIAQNLDNPTDGMKQVYNKVAEFDTKVSIEGSKAESCNIVGIGYTVSACGGYAMLSTPLSMAGGIVAFSIGELSSMKRLIDLSKNYALQLLLPVGIILRTFKLTRGAGGFFIALGVSMHIMIPAGIIFNQMLVDTFLADASASSGYSGGLTSSIDSCDPSQVLFSGGGGEAGKAINIFDSLRADLRRVVFSVLVRGTFGPVLALLLMGAGVRALTSMAGAEVDVSSIARFV